MIEIKSGVSALLLNLTAILYFIWSDFAPEFSRGHAAEMTSAKIL
jgi:hypothetical protein